MYVASQCVLPQLKLKLNETKFESIERFCLPWTSPEFWLYLTDVCPDDCLCFHSASPLDLGHGPGHILFIDYAAGLVEFSVLISGKTLCTIKHLQHPGLAHMCFSFFKDTYSFLQAIFFDFYFVRSDDKVIMLLEKYPHIIIKPSIIFLTIKYVSLSFVDHWLSLSIL